jgi:hypothetical protein
VLEAPVGPYTDNAGLAFDDEGRRLICAAGQEAKLWDIEAQRLVGRWRLPPGLSDVPVFNGPDHLLLLRQETPSSKRPFEVAPGGEPRVLRLYDLLGPNPTQALKQIDDFDAYIYSVAAPARGYFAVMGVSTATGQRIRSTRVYEVATGALVGTLTSNLPPDDTFGLVRFDPTGTRLWGRWNDPDPLRFEVIEVPALKPAGILTGDPDAVDPGASRWLSRHPATTDQPASLSLHERGRTDPLLQVVLDVAAGAPNNSQFTPDGRFVVWGRLDGTVTVCDLIAVNRRLSEIGIGW